MTSLTRPIRCWRVILRHDRHMFPVDVQRRTVLAESVEEAAAQARIRFTLYLTGYYSDTSVPVIVDVKPFVSLCSTSGLTAQVG
jgi:hypothetical protein